MITFGRALVLGSAIVSTLPAEAGAKKIEDLYQGDIVIMTQAPPKNFASQTAFASFLRRNKKKDLWPDKKTETEWQFHFMAFFSRPLNDLEAKVRFYDITEGNRFVAADNVYTSAKGQRILSSSWRLGKPDFSVGRKYQIMLLDSRNVKLATAIFTLRGKQEVYSGKVTFTEDEVSK